MNYQWVIHGLSMDHQWIINGKSMNINGFPWTARAGGTDQHILGEPLGRSWGNRSAGGEQRIPLKKVRTLQASLAGEKTTTTKLVAIRFVVLMCFFGRDSLSDPLQEFSSNTFASPRQPGRLLDAPFSMVRDCMGECVWHAAHPTHAQILA